MLTRILQAFATSSFAQALNYACGFLIAFLFSDVDVANYAKSISIVAIIVVFMDFGCNQLIISRANKGGGEALLKIKTTGIVIVSLAYFLFYDGLFNYYNINRSLILPIYLFSLSVSVLNSVSYLYQSMGLLKRFLTLFYGRVALQSFIVLSFLLITKDYEPIYVWLFVGILSNISLTLIFLYKGKSVFTFDRRFGGGYVSTFKVSIRYLLGAFIVVLILRADAFILGKISDEWLSTYFKVKNIALLLSIISTSISNVFLSDMAKLINLGWEGYLNKVLVVFVFLIPLLLVMIFSFPYFYDELYGMKNNSEFNIFIVLCFAYMSGVITNPLNALLLRAEKSEVLLSLNVIQCVIVYSFGLLFSSYAINNLAYFILGAHFFGLLFTYQYTKRNFDKLKMSIANN
ncbi:Polysaccharide biosynthesis protein [Vibrio crassostreae]|nr:Polysaccharide biosynthesis protein [Vibrio crassostreae]